MFFCLEYNLEEDSFASLFLPYSAGDLPENIFAFKTKKAILKKHPDT
jgi:hypothetical protein